MVPIADRDRIARTLFYVALAGLVYVVLLIFEPFLNPLGWAGVIVIVFHPVHARLERRWGPTRAAAVSTAAVAVIVIAPMLTVMTAFVREAVQAAADLQQAVARGQFSWVERAWAWLQQRSIAAPRIDLAAAAVDAARQLAGALAARAGSVLQNAAVFVFDLFVTLFATFFLFRDASSLMQAFRRMLPLDEPGRERLLAQTRDLVSVSVTSAFIVAAVQGFLGGALFAVLGLDAPVFWGVVMAFFCVLPFGAWVVWLPASILLVASGAVGRGLVLAGFGVALVSAVDNFLRPALLSGRAQINGLVVFISLLGGMRLFGSLGLVLGPTLVATVIGIVRAYTGGEPAAVPSEGVVAGPEAP
jgi:predicted PurR-regulated permease PerM